VQTDSGSAEVGRERVDRHSFGPLIPGKRRKVPSQDAVGFDLDAQFAEGQVEGGTCLWQPRPVDPPGEVAADDRAQRQPKPREVSVVGEHEDVDPGVVAGLSGDAPRSADMCLELVYQTVLDLEVVPSQPLLALTQDRELQG